MLNAVNAREKAIAISNCKHEKDNNIVEEAIEKAVEDGLFQVRFYNTTLSSKIATNLVFLEYTVSRVQGGMNEWDTIVSW